jgi:hypothetical protein
MENLTTAIRLDAIRKLLLKRHAMLRASDGFPSSGV